MAPHTLEIAVTRNVSRLSPEYKNSAIAELESALTPKKEKKEKRAQIA
jgi:hypothetical protein